MNIRIFLRLTAFTTAVIGLTLIALPHFIGDLFFEVTDHNSDIFIQFLGSSLIGYTYLNWQTSHGKKPAMEYPALIGNFSTLLIAFIISLAGVLNHSLKAAGWLIVLLHFTFGSGFGLYLYRYKKANQ
jgi:hypothetical protein